MFEALNYSILARAQEKGIITLHFWNPRDFSQDKHHKVDDTPYGGGPGMVLKIQPLKATLDAIHKQCTHSPLLIYLSPQGKKFTDATARRFKLEDEIILLCGRYEGIDERFISLEVHEEWSIGDFVLSGGEIAAMCITDAITRFLPGTLGDPLSASQDSFSQNLLDYPHYTKPANYQHHEVPPVLLSGNHQLIKQWRLKQAIGRTWQRRPELLQNRVLNKEEQVLLAEFIRENSK